MKVAFLLLLCVCAAYAIPNSFFTIPGVRTKSSSPKSSSRSSSRPRSQTRVRSGSDSRSGSVRETKRPRGPCSGNDVDDVHAGMEYHFSWCNPQFARTKFTGGGAQRYCSRDAPGSGWRAVTIADASENSFIKGIIRSGNYPYIWTGGKKHVMNGNGVAVTPKITFEDWSPTGGRRRPQPDNRMGDENCLAILNNVYSDGIKWHDVACSHTKPVICERPKA